MKGVKAKKDFPKEDLPKYTVADFPKWTAPIFGYQYRWKITHKEQDVVYRAETRDKDSGITVFYCAFDYPGPWTIVWDVSSWNTFEQMISSGSCLITICGPTVEDIVKSFESFVKDLVSRTGLPVAELGDG